MRVCLKSGLNIADPDRVRVKAWLQRGRELVLEIHGTLLRIHDDERGPGGLWPAHYFNVTNAVVPRNWIVGIDEAGILSLAPQRWLEPGFWSALFDDQSGENLTWAQHVQRRQEAEAAYDEELAIILD